MVRGLYRGRVAFDLAAVRGPGLLAHNCKMACWKGFDKHVEIRSLNMILKGAGGSNFAKRLCHNVLLHFNKKEFH